jgi:hypothetical protein
MISSAPLLVTSIVFGRDRDDVSLFEDRDVLDPVSAAEVECESAAGNE